MPPHTAIFVSSNSPRSRKAAIRIQAAFRGYACRKYFQRSVNDELLEELMETEEWERDELVHWEEQEVEALQDRARQLALSHPMPSPTPTLRRSHSQSRSQESEEPLSGGTSLHATVRGFCSSMDHLLRGDFQTEALKDFLPPSWRRRWWDIAEDSPDPIDQLDAIEDCVTFMAAKVKEVVTGVLKLEPLTATSPLRGQVDHFLGFEDRLESSAAAIEQELRQLVGKCPAQDVPVPVQQQLTDFQRHLQREKDCIEEGAYLHGVLELPTTAGAETKFQRQRRLRRGSPNARPSSAGSTGSTDSVGDSASDLLARFQRWRTTCVERACERWRAVLQRREANLAQTMALFTSIQQSLAGGPFGHIPAAGTPLMSSAAQPLNTADPKRGLKDREGGGHHPYKTVATHSGEGWLHPTGNGGAVPRTFTGSLGTFSPHVVIGWEDPPATWPSGALPRFEDVVKPSRAHHALAPLKAKAKLALDQKAVDAATELHLQEASLTSADGLDMYRNAPMFMAAMPT